MSLKTSLMAAVVALSTAGAASAHTAYMLPTTFDATRAQHVTVTSSFTDSFATPEIGVTSKDWHYIAPNGVRYSFDNVVELKQMTVLESVVPQKGTYRFTSGERLGRVGKMIKTATGEYKVARGESGEEPKLADGETFVSSQTATVSDVYVSRGAPTWKSVKTQIGRLHFAPVTHPNEIYQDEGFAIDILFDGKPLAGQEMELMRAGGAYAADKGESKVVTDANGRLNLSFSEPGVYLLMTRHRATAPEGSDTDVRSYTTSLTFEVTE